MPKTFNSPTGDQATVLPQQNFQSTFVDKADRTNVYRKWSEKATVVNFDSASDSYDIIVTTVSYNNTGNPAAANSSRTIRGVRSIIPTSVHQFKAGEVVLLGYISERRESPVILGLRAYQLSSTVTIINTGTTPPVQSCPLRIMHETPTGDVDVTNESELEITCSDAGVAGTASVRLKPYCAVGAVTWTWNMPDDCYSST